MNTLDRFLLAMVIKGILATILGLLAGYIIRGPDASDAFVSFAIAAFFIALCVPFWIHASSNGKHLKFLYHIYGIREGDWNKPERDINY